MFDNFGVLSSLRSEFRLYLFIIVQRLQCAMSKLSILGARAHAGTTNSLNEYRGSSSFDAPLLTVFRRNPPIARYNAPSTITPCLTSTNGRRIAFTLPRSSHLVSMLQKNNHSISSLHRQNHASSSSFRCRASLPPSSSSPSPSPSEEDDNEDSDATTTSTTASIDLQLPRRSRLVGFTCNICGTYNVYMHIFPLPLPLIVVLHCPSCRWSH